MARPNPLNTTKDKTKGKKGKDLLRAGKETGELAATKEIAHCEQEVDPSFHVCLGIVTYDMG